MGAREQEFLQKLLDTFMVEAKEHVGAISSGLVALERACPSEERAEIIESVFREAHSLKGAARAVNRVEIESVCQSLETEFSKLKARGEPPSLEELDRLLQKVDSLAGRLGEAETRPVLPLHDVPRESEEHPEFPAGRLVPRPAQFVERRPAPHTSRVQTGISDERFRIPDTVRVSTLTLDAILQKTEDLILSKVASIDRIFEIRNISSTLLAWEAEWRKARPQRLALERFMEGQVDSRERPLSQLDKALSLLLQGESALQALGIQVAAFRKELESDGRTLDRKIDGLLTDAKRMAMLPFSSILETLPKAVRELCRDFRKNAALLIEGGDIAADRRILEEIKDPLIHLIRNCVDHGIEPPSERAKQQKEVRATIAVVVSAKDGGRVEIAVSDDGAGVDVREVRAAAIRLGLLAEVKEYEIGDQEALSLLFQSGFSTSPKVTEVSGRGLGLAIVREKVERLGGSISLETELGKGTTFRLLLPLTLATLRGLLVRVGEHVYVLPSMHVQRVLRVDRSEVKSVENRETFQCGGRAVALVRLSNVLGIADKAFQGDGIKKAPGVLLVWAGERMVVLVDEVLKEQEIVLKSLGSQLLRVRNIQGATILGSGKVAAVLSVGDLFGSAATAASTVAQVSRPASEMPIDRPVEKEASVLGHVIGSPDSIAVKNDLGDDVGRDQDKLKSLLIEASGSRGKVDLTKSPGYEQ